MQLLPPFCSNFTHDLPQKLHFIPKKAPKVTKITLNGLGACN